jgi:hypothetical protein
VYDENRSPVEGATVYLDSTVAGYTDIYGKLVIGNTTAGSYQLKIRKDGFESVQQAITIARQGDEFSFELPYNQANLTIVVRDKDQNALSGVRVLLNANDLGLSGDNGQVVTRIAYNTAANITAIKDGYQTTSVQKTIAFGNSSSSVTLVMEKTADWGLIGMVIVGVAAILVVVAVIRQKMNKPGKHIRRRNEI